MNIKQRRAMAAERSAKAPAPPPKRAPNYGPGLPPRGFVTTESTIGGGFGGSAYGFPAGAPRVFNLPSGAEVKARPVYDAPPRMPVEKPLRLEASARKAHGKGAVEARRSDGVVTLGYAVKGTFSPAPRALSRSGRVYTVTTNATVVVRRATKRDETKVKEVKPK